MKLTGTKIKIMILRTKTNNIHSHARNANLQTAIKQYYSHKSTKEPSTQQRMQY